MTIPVCACGAPKTENAGLWLCEHCDGRCTGKTSCARCNQFNTATNKRIIHG